jgi:hypothetical protein
MAYRSPTLEARHAEREYHDLKKRISVFTGDDSTAGCRHPAHRTGHWLKEPSRRGAQALFPNMHRGATSVPTASNIYWQNM